jgi:hypothetical protein
LRTATHYQIPGGGGSGTSSAGTLASDSNRCRTRDRTVSGIIDVSTRVNGLGIERGRCIVDLEMYWDGCSVTACVLPGDGSFSGLFSGIKYHVNTFSTGAVPDDSGCQPCCASCCCVLFAVTVSVTGIITSSDYYKRVVRVCGNGNYDVRR